MDLLYTLVPHSNCRMRMASPALSDSSTIRTTTAPPDQDTADIDALFSDYQTACAVKAQAEKDLRAAIHTRRALALEELRQAEANFKKINALCDDMLRGIRESPEEVRNGTIGMLDAFQTASNNHTTDEHAKELEEFPPESGDQDSALSRPQPSLDTLLASPESDDTSSQPFINYRNSVGNNLALAGSDRSLDLSTVRWPTFVHFPDRSFPTVPRRTKCKCAKCRRSNIHNKGLVYEADIHLVDDMISFIEAYIRWAAQKGVDKILVVDEMRSKWKRIVDAAVGGAEKRWKGSLILGAINLAEDRLANNTSQVQ